MDSFLAHGASQCGFCTPGILCRLAALPEGADAESVESALLAHLCRCTGWRSIVEAGTQALAAGTRSAAATGRPAAPGATERPGEADRRAAGRRATLEGGVAQAVSPSVAMGLGGFAIDTVPLGAVVAVPDGNGSWSVAPTLREARAAVGRLQGRRSGKEVGPPVDLPPGQWALTLQTTWVEPGYLEPDASWCEPGGVPSSPVANGGAFGAKLDSPAPAAAQTLAERLGVPVLAVLSREDTVRMGPKRPPLAAGVRADGTGVVRVVRTPGIAEAIALVAPGLLVEEVDVAGPPTSARIRAAGWAEGAVLLAGLRALTGGGAGTRSTSSTSSTSSPGTTAGTSGTGTTRSTASTSRTGRAAVSAPGGGRADAEVTVDAGGRPVHVAVDVDAGEVLDEIVLRSYVTGAAHMGLGWVTSEAIAVGDDGIPEDLTIRSWGVLRARDTPPVEITVADGAGREPVAVGDAVFAAVAAAVWIAQGLPPRWPTRRGGDSKR